MPDPGEPSSEDSIIRKARQKAKKTMDDYKWIEPLIRWAVIAALGTGAGMASHRVGDAQEEVQHQQSVAELRALQQELKELRAGILQRVDVEENEREGALKRIDRRLTWLEAKLDISAPPAAEASSP